MVCMLIADINSQMLSFSVGCLESEIIRKFLTVRGIYIFAIGAEATACTSAATRIGFLD